MRLPFVGKPDDRSEGAKVAWLEGLYKAADSQRKHYESEWYANIAFLQGDQWSSFSEDVRRFRKTPVHVPHSKAQITSNQILPLARQAVSAMVNNMAQRIAIPATEDPDDVEAAELATDFLDARRLIDRESEVLLHETLWRMVTGRVIRETYWDPDRDGTGEIGVLPRAGDIATVTLNPFKFHQCPWTDCSEQLPWVIFSDVRDIDEINHLYPGHDVKEESYADTLQTRDNLLNSAMHGRNPEPRKKHAAILKRLYARPDYRRPNGYHAVWANEKLLYEGELPEGQWSCVTVDWFPAPGRPYPYPFVSPLRDLQREINITLSQIIELRNRQLRGDLLIQGSALPTQDYNPALEEYSSAGAKRIYLDATVEKYEFLKYDLNPSQAESLLAHFWNDVMQVAGIHESSLGTMPSRGQPTATQVLTLKESDYAGLALFRAIGDEAYCDVDRVKLLIAKNHYEIPRMIRVVGESNSAKTRSFFGAELRNTEDVRPRPIPIITEAQKAEMKSQAAAQGLYGPYAGPADKYAKLKALSNSGIPDINEEIDELLGGISMDELGQIVAELDAKKAQLALLESDAAIAQLEALMQQASTSQEDDLQNPLSPPGQTAQQDAQPI